MSVPHSISLEPFDKLVEQLRLHGFTSAADSIAELRSAGWTSSSEMLGELGLTVLKIQRQSNDWPDAVTYLLRRCMIEVRKVCPDIK